MKKMRRIMCSVGMVMSLCGCNNASTLKKVTIIKQLDHSSINEIAQSIKDEFGDNEVMVDIVNGQNDPSTMQMLVQKASTSDVIVPIGTISAEIAVASMKNTPVVYAAVSDPETAGLLDVDGITGTSDVLDIQKMYDMMVGYNKELTKVGLLYSLSEANSRKPIQDMKNILDQHNISYVEACGNTSDEIVTALQVLLAKGVDVVFTPTDNIVMSCETVVSSMCKKHSVPHFAGADSFVYSGAFATCGINYKELGKETANLIKDVMNDKKTTTSCVYVQGNEIVINKEYSDLLGFDVNKYKDLGNLHIVESGE